MNKDRYDFILRLITNKKLSLSQRERILILSTLEFKKVDESFRKDIKNIKEIEENLLKRIEDIEIKLSTDNVRFSVAESSKQKILPEPNPRHVADFMSLFNKREGLKYLTHDYDEEKEFKINDFLLYSNNIFKVSTEKLHIPQSLWRIVQQFAFDSKQSEWSSISNDYRRTIPVKIGWASKELRNWSINNRLHPIRNEVYKNVIDNFKRITRIESPNLERLIDTVISGVLGTDVGTFKIEKVDLLKADFYSHVSSLKIAIETIFEEIKKRADSDKKKNISVRYQREISDDGYYLRKIVITHYNSFPLKELDVVLKEWNEKGNMGKIKEKLHGYCHWSIETLIEDKPIRVNLLRDKKTLEYEVIENIMPTGFNHILTFYYK
ncbi:hypothetical protein [Sphingobacterium multivorum]|uniref:hypothetical protein n=1 Tax=Sphingobacterium multivorum TaxID=28454 RepID=UPI0036BDCDED